MKYIVLWSFAYVAAAAQLGDLLGHGMGGMTHSGFGGEEMQRTFTKYATLPLGQAALEAAGWMRYGGCDPYIGFQWFQSHDTPAWYKRKQPLTLFTTAGGQISGVGVGMFGYSQWQNYSQYKYFYGGFDSSDGDGLEIRVAFRGGDDFNDTKRIMCGGGRDEDILIGDRLIVNPGGHSDKRFFGPGEEKHIPLTEDASAADGWHRGSCFDTMGWHRFLDTKVGSQQMSWQAENLFPVVAMYHEGQINAIFFSSMEVQNPFTSSQWEPVPLIDYLMCKNFCDSDCTFHGTSAFSTMHIYFRDHSEVKCDPSLKCFAKGMGCCAKSESKDILV